jgi:hypothetical protein
MENNSAQSYLEGLNAQAVPSENPTGSFVKAIQYIFWNFTKSQQSRRHLVEERVTNAVAHDCGWDYSICDKDSIADARFVRYDSLTRQPLN